MYRREFLLGVAGSAPLFSCTDDYPRANLDAISRVKSHYRGKPYVALISAVNTQNQNSEHSAVLVAWDGFRALYDPAGSYWITKMPRRDDINYGVSDFYLAHYQSYHARLGVFVERLEIAVHEGLSRAVYAAARHEGESSKFLCALAASRTLARAGGVFATIKPSLSPERLRRQFATLPGVARFVIHEDDAGQILRQITVDGFDPDDTAPPPKPEFGRGEP